MRASGGFPERFLNLCSRGNIPYWDVCCTNGVVFARTTPEGYRMMRPCAKKAGMRMKIVKKSGLPFLLSKNRVHAGLAVGAVCFILITAALSGRIWTVNVDVREGVGKSVKKNDAPCDIVAAADGQIQTLEIFSGTAMQERNAAVLKGDTIISGIVENRDGGMSMRHAAGYITALTKHTFSTSSHSLPSRKISDVKSRYTLLFFSLKIPLGSRIDPDFTEDRFLTLGGEKLPIGIRAERKYIFAPADATDDSLSDLITLEEHFYKSSNNLRDMLVMSRTTTERQSDGRAVFFSEYGCLQNIGEERRIEAGE